MAISLGLENKRILVLGGGQGMGEATVRQLIAAGAHVVVADRELDRAERVVAEVTDGGGSASAVAIDVLDDDALVAGLAAVERDHGPLDGMATVIGMAGWSTLLEMDLDTWDTDHRRNLRFFFLAAREVSARLIARGAPGSIVCVGSVDGERCAPFHGSYGTAKAGLSNLVKTMAVEWSPHGIRANVVAPGAIVTPRVPHLGEQEEVVFGRLPLRRRGTVDEIASAIVFMLSDMASYVSGQTLVVDGGMLAAYPLDLRPPAKPGSTMGEG